VLEAIIDEGVAGHEAGCSSRVAPQEMTVEQLVEQFAAITLDQDRAIRTDDNAKYNRLFRQMRVVEERLLRAIADSNDNPLTGDAGMCLAALDRGIFKPT
jgi:hypothetical protein